MTTSPNNPKTLKRVLARLLLAEEMNKFDDMMAYLKKTLRAQGRVPRLGSFRENVGI